MKNNLTIHSIFIYSTLFLIAFFYCFGIETFKDVDMQRYFVNGFYMSNYGIEGVKGYPNQLFSFFLYWGYKLTNSWYGLSNILFSPLYLFGVYSLYMVLNYFIKQNYSSLLFTILFLLVNKSSDFALGFYSYTIYFFFFISTIYLCLYHSKNIYLIGFYFAIGTLFRNQLITFLPFLPFIVNPKIKKIDYIKTIMPMLIALVVVQVGYEAIKSMAISIPEQEKGANFSFYIKEIDKFLLRKSLLSFKSIKLFFRYNPIHYYFYLVLIPCFFMFNKKFATKKEQSTKPLLTIFLILALFIYFMPAIMYITAQLSRSWFNYYDMLSRYSFIMIPLLIPIYHFILKEQTFIKLNNNMAYVAMVIVLLPILSLDKAPVFIKNTITNISHKQELYGIDSAKVKSILKANFKENAFFISNKWITQIFIGYKDKFMRDNTIENQNIYNKKFNYNEIDAVILIDESYPYLNAGETTYIKIYPENDDKTISIYKKIE